MVTPKSRMSRICSNVHEKIASNAPPGRGMLTQNIPFTGSAFSILPNLSLTLIKNSSQGGMLSPVGMESSLSPGSHEREQSLIEETA